MNAFFSFVLILILILSNQRMNCRKIVTILTDTRNITYINLVSCNLSNGLN